LLKTGAVAGLGQAVGVRDASAADKPVRIGLVGLGRRGMAHVGGFLDLEGVEIAALCDVKQEQVDKAQSLVRNAGRAPVDEYTRGQEDYRRLCDRPDLDAVVVSTPWEWHAPMMIATMEAGKYGAVEVNAALTVDGCHQLVETSERTGMPCMMLENANYGRSRMMVLNMVRQGLFGEMLHCEAGYQHDVREGKFLADGSLRYRGVHSVLFNGNLYPTHPIGPVSWFLDINRGDRFEYLVSMSTMSRGINNYAAKRFGPDHPNATRPYKLGDINTTLIRTAKGRTITLYHDTNTPRPYDPIHRVQGTKGIYSESLKKIYIEGRSPTEHGWEDITSYETEYDHPMWRRHLAVAEGSGHGGMDGLCRLDFIKAVRKKTQTPIDVYDSVTWSVIIPLSIESVANKSRPVDFPDFTRGKWKTNKPIPIEAG